MISVKRDRDGKVFTNDMRKGESIYEMHFCTSYTQVMVQELDENGKLTSGEIFCPPTGTDPHWIDLIATQNGDTGVFVGHCVHLSG